MALVTETPPTVTGFSRATGVIASLQPIAPSFGHTQPASMPVMFAITWLAYVGFYLTRKSFSVAKIGIQDDPTLKMTDHEMALVDGAYLIAYAVGQFIFGMAGDRSGTRRVIVTGMLFFLAAPDHEFATPPDHGASMRGALLAAWKVRDLARLQRLLQGQGDRIRSAEQQCESGQRCSLRRQRRRARAGRRNGGRRWLLRKPRVPCRR